VHESNVIPITIVAVTWSTVRIHSASTELAYLLRAPSGCFGAARIADGNDRAGELCVHAQLAECGVRGEYAIIHADHDSGAFSPIGRIVAKFPNVPNN
jgi:hypothetical protein